MNYALARRDAPLLGHPLHGQPSAGGYAPPWSLRLLKAEVAESETRVLGRHHLELHGDRDDLAEMIRDSPLVDADPHRLPRFGVAVGAVGPAAALVHRDTPAAEG